MSVRATDNPYEYMLVDDMCESPASDKASFKAFVNVVTKKKPGLLARFIRFMTTEEEE